MSIVRLKKIVDKRKRRLGQGHGSGRVKTSGRGTKGQNAKGKRSLWFEGGAVSLIKRLPFRRGKGKNKVFRKKPIVINVKVLNIFSKGDTVDIKSLAGKRLVDLAEAKTYGVKILGDGDLNISLKVNLPVSGGAKKKIEKAGGSVLKV